MEKVEQPGDDALLRVEHVAAKLRLSRALVYRLIASGDLPAVRIGRSVRVAPAKLRAWLRERGA